MGSVKGWGGGFTPCSSYMVEKALKNTVRKTSLIPPTGTQSTSHWTMRLFPQCGTLSPGLLKTSNNKTLNVLQFLFSLFIAVAERKKA